MCPCTINSGIRQFESYHVPIDMEEWPDDPVETQRLKALLSSARKKIVQFFRDTEFTES